MQTTNDEKTLQDEEMVKTFADYRADGVRLPWQLVSITLIFCL
jgi:hypothetical protein